MSRHWLLLRGTEKEEVRRSVSGITAAKKQDSLLIRLRGKRHIERRPKKKAKEMTKERNKMNNRRKTDTGRPIDHQPDKLSTHHFCLFQHYCLRAAASAADLERVVLAELEETKTPGAVRRNRARRLPSSIRKASASRMSETAQPVTPEMLFRIGSMNKSIPRYARLTRGGKER